MDSSVITERGPKVRVIASRSTWMEGEALRQLDATATFDGMRLCVGMPDLHPGKGGPVGAAFLSEGYIYPALVGSDIGCGMSLWATTLPVRKVRLERLAARMHGLDSLWEGDTAAWLAARDLDPTPHDASLGSPGRGNHFIEWQDVAEIGNAEAMAALGIEPGRLCLLVHSGSRGLGEAVARGHGPPGVRAASAEGETAANYLAAHDKAVRWAEANRDLCAARALEAAGTDGRRVLDICHNLVSAACVGGHTCWLHRKGAAPSDRGAVVVPGSRGDLSYLVRPMPGREDTLWSLAHGAGRRIARSEARGKLRGRYRRDDLRTTTFGGCVVCGDEALLWEEAPEAYKPGAAVVGDLEAAGLLEVLATMRPVVTFKTSEVNREETRRDDAWRRDRRAARLSAHRNGPAFAHQN